MPFRKQPLARKLPIAVLLFLAVTSLPVLAQKVAESRANNAIWTDPGDIHSKDLTYGSGGENHQPQLPVKFVDEDKSGHNSKLDVEDSRGTKWKTKLGIEAQPETVATRLMWAIGYFTNEDYYVTNLEVDGLPAHLRRGQGHVFSPNHLDQVRLQHTPEGEKKTANWNWKHNPFVGTREFNGLRVMMALLGNWDLKTENNAVFQDKNDGHQQYMVTDVGTAFGPSGNRFTEASSKNNLKAYRSAKFIAKVTPKYVDFNFPRVPPLIYVFDFPHFVHQISMRWVGNRVPRADAKWVGSLLAQLSKQQIESAFRAGGYTPDQAAAFTQVVEARISELNRL
jgi:hypothetical protein